MEPISNPGGLCTRAENFRMSLAYAMALFAPFAVLLQASWGAGSEAAFGPLCGPESLFDPTV